MKSDISIHVEEEIELSEPHVSTQYYGTYWETLRVMAGPRLVSLMYSAANVDQHIDIPFGKVDEVVTALLATLREYNSLIAKLEETTE